MRKRPSSDPDVEQLTLGLDLEPSPAPTAVVEAPPTPPAAVEPAGAVTFSRASARAALPAARPLPPGPLDRQFGAFLERRAASTGSALVRWAGMLVSQARSLGFSHLDLRHPPARLTIPEELAGDLWPDLAHWHEALSASGLVVRGELVPDPGAAGDEECLPELEEAFPLTLSPDGGKLYLTRYWQAERYIAHWIRQRRSQPVPLSHAEPAELGREISAAFEEFTRQPPSQEAAVDWQKAAVLLALRRGFAVVTGGPGTGKTAIVRCLLQALAKLPGGASKRCALAAPTGKAAARMQETLEGAGKEFGFETPPRIGTLHRLLGVSREGRGNYYNERLPLAENLVVLDECSMVDLVRLEQLLRALPPGTGLVLLGDADQLASVEVGGVLGELRTLNPIGALDASFCQDYAAAFGHELVSTAEEASRPTTMLQLQRNYRFGEGNAIHALSQAIRRRDTAEALRLLALAESDPDSTPGLQAHRYPAAEPPVRRLERLAREWFGAWREFTDPAEALAALHTRRLLTPLRGGPLGVLALNELVARVLGPGAPPGENATWAGRPILVLQNDYRLRLHNGDTGILLPEPEDGEGRLRAWFPGDVAGDGAQMRSLATVRLPAHETAYAMTVHKSQGSEFQEVALLLPPEPSEVLTRELIYTAVTRASQAVEVWYEAETLQWALERNAPRTCRLGDLLL